ncbi:MAG TPA: LLM class F420-dependent oxidoreductase [Nitrososphaeraceae archaeon]|nr:LLM class F420-dependent oxidoreductase [Nitrososphaeraceae archaeon]
MKLTNAMKVGMLLPSAGEQATRKNIIQAAKQAEEERFDSLWTWERLISPLKPQTPYPLTPDGSFPIEFQSLFEPLETLTFVAANTNKIALGTSILDMLFHNPVVLAKRLATLDILSEGRAIAGLGIGWLKDEYQISSIPMESRGKRADEYIQLLKKLWTDDVVEFKGEFYDIPASKIGPKPLHKPHLPIYMGAFSPKAFGRAIKYADGWIGMIAGTLDDFEGAVNMIRDMAKEKEKESNRKDVNEFKVVLLTYPKVAEGSSSTHNKKGERPPMTGSVDEIGGDLRRIKDMGVEHIIFGYSFLPIGRNVNKMIDTTKQLSKFCS